ncbi:MAG: NADH-quinone oxidoreductase subunit M [Bacteroidetes bacterium]|nr:NADH-quinone oxidoreductase subunit M [Bacteroidota bacterium]
MLTLLLLGIPFLSALVLFFGKSQSAKSIALTTTLLGFILSLAALFVFKTNPNSDLLKINLPWIDSLGVRFDLSITAVGILLVLLSNFLLPLIVLSAFKNEYKRAYNFFALILLMQSAMLGVFMANDGFLFYVFWELALIPIYFICLLWGGEDRGRITFKFFVYTLLGSLFMLIGLIYIYNHTNVNGLKSWNVNDMYAAGKLLTVKQQSIVFWFIFLAFAVKMPVFPFHTWQPNTYVNAPTQGTMLLSGIMLKMGTFGAIKWLLPMVPMGVAHSGGTAITLSIIGIVYASCIAIVQTDYKRLIAYSSIAHVGFMSAGILAANQQGIQGAYMQMLAHGCSVVGLFLVADILFRHTGTRDITKLGGIRNMNGNFAVLFLIITFDAVALPFTNSFVGEFITFSGVFKYSLVASAFAGLTIILSAVYMLRSYQKIMLGEIKQNAGVEFGPLASSDKTILIVICIAIIAFGVYPKPLNDIAEEGAKQIITLIKQP